MYLFIHFILCFEHNGTSAILFHYIQEEKEADKYVADRSKTQQITTTF